MNNVISIHEYELKPGLDPATFEDAVRAAEARGLFRLPGLIGHRFIKGIKGQRRGAFAAIWTYEDRDAWQRLWGSPEEPRQFSDYPLNWQIWEQEYLAPLLTRIPDTIRFTVYEVL